jgi:hypothetical protein
VPIGAAEKTKVDRSGAIRIIDALAQSIDKKDQQL